MYVGRFLALEVWAVEQPYRPVPEVHRLLSHHIDQCPLLVGGARQAVLPCDVAQDRVALGQLDVSVQIVGQVGKVQSERKLECQPITKMVLPVFFAPRINTNNESYNADQAIVVACLVVEPAGLVKFGTRPA